MKIVLPFCEIGSKVSDNFLSEELKITSLVSISFVILLDCPQHIVVLLANIKAMSVVFVVIVLYYMVKDV